MSYLFRNSIFIKSLFILALFGFLTEAAAQTIEQIARAKSLGIDIKGLNQNYNNQQTKIGDNKTTIRVTGKDKKADMRSFIGFSAGATRFGSDLFSVERKFAIADDAQVPEDYLLGLGDQIIIQYYGAESGEFVLNIDRTGAILLPKIGPINLNGLNFDEAKQLIRSRVNNQLVGVNATISIGKTKNINIFIAGNVKVPGMYSMPSLSRVTYALYLAGGITKLGTYRNIQVKRQGKLVGSVDLYDFLLEGDNSSDINLRPNDVIFVGDAGNALLITGAVKRQGVFELTGEENAETLIAYAGGLQPGGDKHDVVYLSLMAQIPNQILDFSTLKDFVFFDGDSIHFKFKSSAYKKVNGANLSLNKPSAIRVKIQGEVSYPGTYLLSEGERITDLIERAGGLTEAAFMDGAIFTREKVRKNEVLRSRELAEELRRNVVSYIQTQDTGSVGVDNLKFTTDLLENFSGVGRVIIDLPRALAGRNDADLALENGDALLIPRKNNTVAVFGEVRRPSSQVYNPEFEIEDYLTLAAGITQLADEDNIYIVKPNGNISFPKGGWFKYGSNKLISEGDTIIVPVDAEYRSNLPFWRDVVSIVYQSAVAIAAIGGL